MTAVQRSHRMTVEEAWLARQRAASTVDGRPSSPAEPASTDAGDDDPERRPARPLAVIDGSARSSALGTAESAEAPITAPGEAAAQSATASSTSDRAAASPTTADAARPPLGQARMPAPRTVPSGADPAPHVIDASAPSTSSHPVARAEPPIIPAPHRPEVRPPARPRIEAEPAILGLSRHTRSRLGSRLFNLFFVFVFLLILVQMVVALLTP